MAPLEFAQPLERRSRSRQVDGGLQATGGILTAVTRWAATQMHAWMDYSSHYLHSRPTKTNAWTRYDSVCVTVIRRAAERTPSMIISHPSSHRNTIQHCWARNVSRTWHGQLPSSSPSRDPTAPSSRNAPACVSSRSRRARKPSPRLASSPI